MQAVATLRRRKNHNRAGQAIIFLMMVLVILFFVVLWNFDLHKYLHVKTVSQNGGDAAALAAGRWQGITLNLIGDLNITDQQSLYLAVTSNLRDAHRVAGWGMGFTFTRFVRLGLPMWRIDYVLYSSHVVALRTHVGDNDGSDHRPLYAELAFLAPP